MKNFKRTSTKQLGEVLVERGVIDHEQVLMAIALTGGRRADFWGSLSTAKVCDRRGYRASLTCQYGFPYLPLANYEIDREVIAAIPRMFAVSFVLSPVDKIGKSLTLAMADP